MIVVVCVCVFWFFVVYVVGFVVLGLVGVGSFVVVCRVDVGGVV